jgi:hypothetical protein
LPQRMRPTSFPFPLLSLTVLDSLGDQVAEGLVCKKRVAGNQGSRPDPATSTSTTALQLMCTRASEPFGPDNNLLLSHHFPKSPRRTSVMEHLASTVVKLCSSIKLPRPCLGSSVAPVKAQRAVPFALERAQDRRYRRRGAWQ